MTKNEAAAWNRKMQRAKERKRKARERARLEKLKRINAAPLPSDRNGYKGAFPNGMDTYIVQLQHEVAPELSAVPAIAAWAGMFRQPTRRRKK